MFKRATTICTALLVLSTVFWGCLFMRVTQTDLVAAKKIQQEQEMLSSKNVVNTAHQDRKGVVKDIWFTQEDGLRLHTRIFSESSLLTIKPDGRKFDLIEKLEKITCWMQDKLYASTPTVGPMQQLRFLQAREGLYRFTTQEFLAQSVALSLYKLQGHELPQNANNLH